MDDKGSKNVGTYFGLALMIAGSTFLGYAVGYGLDKLFGTHFFNVTLHEIPPINQLVFSN